MAVRPTVLLTCGTPGSHKTYVRCAEFLIKWVRFESGIHYSNFPVNVDALAAYMLKHYKIAEEETRRKVRVFPGEELLAWQRVEEGKRFDPTFEVRGPWSWMAENGVDNISGCHVAIDEAHIFLPKSGQVTTRRRWGDWLAEIRHSGCTVEFITQHLDRLHDDPQRMADERIEVTNLERRYDPFFRIPMASWYELRAAFIGLYVPCVLEQYQRKQSGKWTVEFSRRYYPNPAKYALYNSYSATQSAEGAVTGGKRVLHVFEQRGQFGTVKWFLANYWLNLLITTSLLGGGFIAVLHGIPWALTAQREFFEKALAPKRDKVATAEVVEKKAFGAPAVPAPSEALPASAPAETERPPAVVSERIQVLEAQLEERETIVNDQAEKLWELREKAGQLFLIAPDHVVWANGAQTQIGEEIRDNVYEGRTVESIDFRKREITLDDGYILRIGRLRDTAPGVDTEERTELGGVLRKRSAGSAEGGTGGPGGTSVDDVGGRDADGFVSAIPEPGNGDLDNRSEQSGLATGDVGDSRPDSGISPTGRGASAGRGNLGTGQSVLRGGGGTGGQSHSGAPSWASNLRRDRTSD